MFSMEHSFSEELCGCFSADNKVKDEFLGITAANGDLSFGFDSFSVMLENSFKAK